MLWVLSWQELTLDSCPIRGKWCHHFRPTSWFWQPQTSLSVGPPTCNDQKWVVNELLCEFATEFQLAQQDRCRQKCKCNHCIHLSQQVQAQTRIPLPTCSCAERFFQWDWRMPQIFAVIKQKEHQRICPSWECCSELNGTPCLVVTKTEAPESNELLP